LLPENADAGKPVSSQQQSQSSSVAPKKLDRRVIVGVALAVVALVLAALAAVMPWWHIDATVKGQGIAPPTFNWDFSTGARCYRSSGNYRCTAYGDTSNSGAAWSSVQCTFGVGFILLIAGIAAVVVTLIMIVVSSRRKKGRTVTLALGILGTALLLGAILYVFAALPGAFMSDYKAAYSGPGWNVPGFFGSTLYNIDNGVYRGTETFSYYGALGWWLVLLSAILLIAGTVVACGRKGTAAQPKVQQPSPEQAK